MIEELIDRIQMNPDGARSLWKLREEDLARRVRQMLSLRLRLERLWAGVFGRRARPRVMATACWGFPIYSQTFVYQELSQLIGRGFNVRFLYSKLNPRDHLPSQFSRLWRAKRKLVLHPAVCKHDYEYFARRIPDKVETLVEQLCRASGMPPQQIRTHYHFLQAFAFTRMVEACRPDYLHSYFFYEGTLFTFVASYLLGIPRGVSCYTDHMLDDYALKVVQLHLQQCSLVVATSERIKRELIRIAPGCDPGRIIVKPNAINSERFPFVERQDPGTGQPYRLICVSRIEPKKGTLYLIEAVRRLLDKGIKVNLHLLGGVDDNLASKEYARAVDLKIQELRLGGLIRLEGRKGESEIQRLLKASHLFVAPFVETESGDKDGIPTALLEAMSSGLAAVATDAGSIAEVIDDGLNGVLVAQHDAGALAIAIESLLLDPARRQRLGREAALKIRQHFDVGVCERVFHDRLRVVVGVQNA